MVAPSEMAPAMTIVPLKIERTWRINARWLIVLAWQGANHARLAGFADEIRAADKEHRCADGGQRKRSPKLWIKRHVAAPGPFVRPDPGRTSGSSSRPRSA